MKLTDFSTLTFDCYGTLIDWETGIYQAFLPLLNDIEPTPSRDQCLRVFSEIESKIQAEFPDDLYTEILYKVHIAAADYFGLKAVADSQHIKFGNSVARWPAFPDSASSLQYLKQHYRLVILSNVDQTSFSFSNRQLQVQFDAVYTAQDIGSYKPSINNFTYMLSKLADEGIQKSDILHTAQSLYHDMAPAKSLNLASCWIDRRAGQTGSGATPQVEAEIEVDFRFESLAAMVAAHQNELSS